jgi:hypothetical protein
MKQETLNKIIDIIRESLYEDVPTNNVGGGQIAGTAEAGDDPPVRRRKRKRYIYGKGLRKIWKPENGGAS